MPNGHGQREKHEKELIKAVEEDGWRVYPDPPNWVLSKAKSDGIDKRAGFTPKKNMYHGDNYIYLAISSAHGLGIHVFSQKKSEYYETTTQEGTCPNCQQYVRRYDDDEYLTCHRCGWQYRPLSERIRNLFG